MITIGLIGKSGTGKSTIAPLVAKDNDADFIIDDGLLISVKDSKIVAGEYAHTYLDDYEKVNDIALFHDKNNTEKVKSALDTYHPEKILILGSTFEMLCAITNNLEIPRVIKLIDIKDILSQEEINKALYSREKTRGYSLPILVESLGDFKICEEGNFKVTKKGDSTEITFLE